MPSHSPYNAAPGYAGFIPSLKYQFGETYGNATRHTPRPTRTTPKKNETLTSTNDATAKRIVDDRFSVPPVPGYTGYIPHSKEHFALPYVQATRNAFKDFKESNTKRDALPESIQNLRRNTRTQPQPKKTNSPSTAFISGYTGYVPRAQNYFGQTYTTLAAKATDDFHGKRHQQSITTAGKPIPGFTGYQPGKKFTFETSNEHKINKPITGYKGHIPGYAFSSSRSFTRNLNECLQK